MVSLGAIPRVSSQAAEELVSRRAPPSPGRKECVGGHGVITLINYPAAPTTIGKSRRVAGKIRLVYGPARCFPLAALSHFPPRAEKDNTDPGKLCTFRHFWLLICQLVVGR